VGTNDAALARLATIGQSPAEKARLEEINRGIDATMRAVIHDAKYNPNALDSPVSKVTPVGAVVAKAVGERWVDPAPLEVPGGATSQRLIEQMCDAMLGPGAPAARERRGSVPEAVLARAVAAARAELAKPEPAAPEAAEAAPISAEPVAAPVPVVAEVASAVLVAAVAAPKAGTITRRKLA
jgi:hypothetical protein